MNLRLDDMVEVIAGQDKFTRGKILKVLPKKRKVVVEGVNRIYKHVRRSQRNPKGGQLSKEMPVSISNVMLVCGSCGKPARMGSRYSDDGSKQRFCKKCGAANGEIAPPKTAYAKT